MDVQPGCCDFGTARQGGLARTASARPSDWGFPSYHSPDSNFDGASGEDGTADGPALAGKRVGSCAAPSSAGHQCVAGRYTPRHTGRSGQLAGFGHGSHNSGDDHHPCARLSLAAAAAAATAAAAVAAVRINVSRKTKCVLPELRIDHSLVGKIRHGKRME